VLYPTTTLTTMAVMAYDASDILQYDDSRGPGPDQPLTAWAGAYCICKSTQPAGVDHRRGARQHTASR
jgi:hypothetical protein